LALKCFKKVLDAYHNALGRLCNHRGCLATGMYRQGRMKRKNDCIEFWFRFVSFGYKMRRRHRYTLYMTVPQGRACTVKKDSRFSRPQPGCHLPNTLWPGIIKLFPVRESLVSDIPAGDGKIINLFLQCGY
jgi:hypothetical protein